MTSEFRSPMDDEIDDVARSMMAASPSAALRSGVRDRIAGRSGGSHVGRWPLGIAAAAAVIALATVWPDRKAPVDPPASSPAVVTVAPPPAIDPSMESRPMVIRDAPVQPDTVRPGRAQALSIASGPPLEVEQLEWAPLETPALDDSMLVVEGLQIEPLVRQQ